MDRKPFGTTLFLAVLLIVPALASCRAEQVPQTLIVNGQPTHISVVQLNGHSYVDLEALARAANLTSNSEFSKGFMRAGIEQMTIIREWRTALANAIQNQFPITDD